MEKIKKILMLYGNSYVNCGIDSLSETLSIIDHNISVDLFKNPIEAFEKIKEYDVMIMGLIWSEKETKEIIDKENFSLSQAKDIVSKHNELFAFGLLLYYIFQNKYPIKTIIYDTTLYSEKIANEADIMYLKMPELSETIIQKINSL